MPHRLSVKLNLSVLAITTSHADSITPFQNIKTKRQITNNLFLSSPRDGSSEFGYIFNKILKQEDQKTVSRSIIKENLRKILQLPSI